MRNKLCTIISIVVLLLPMVAGVSIGRIENREQSMGSLSEISDMIDLVDEELVYYYHDKLMRFGPRYTSSINCTLAAQYIYDEFEEMGLEVSFHEWKTCGFHSKNVVATLRGVDSESTAIFIICAHYDTVPLSPGANDDGSGVAAVLATAHVMSQYSFNHTVRFIAFSGEEVGTYGSFCYARDAYNMGDNIVAVLNADMVGYADTTEGGRILRFFYPERSVWIPEFAALVSDKYIEQIDMVVEPRPNYIGADHQAFVYYGYDGVWIAHHDGYQWGHSPEDIAEHINWTYQMKATKFLLAVLAELAMKPIDVQVILTSPLEGYGYFFNRPVIPLSIARYWALGLRGITVILGRAMACATIFSNEEIKHVVFCIDGNFISWDSEPPYEWQIQGRFTPLRGKHVLKVYAYTKSGKFSSDEMDIIIFTRSYLYK